MYLRWELEVYATDRSKAVVLVLFLCLGGFVDFTIGRFMLSLVLLFDLVFFRPV